MFTGDACCDTAPVGGVQQTVILLCQKIGGDENALRELA